MQTCSRSSLTAASGLCCSCSSLFLSCLGHFSVSWTLLHSAQTLYSHRSTGGIFAIFEEANQAQDYFDPLRQSTTPPEIETATFPTSEQAALATALDTLTRIDSRDAVHVQAADEALLSHLSMSTPSNTLSATTVGESMTDNIAHTTLSITVTLHMTTTEFGGTLETATGTPSVTHTSDEHTSETASGQASTAITSGTKLCEVAGHSGSWTSCQAPQSTTYVLGDTPSEKDCSDIAGVPCPTSGVSSSRNNPFSYLRRLILRLTQCLAKGHDTCIQQARDAAYWKQKYKDAVWDAVWVIYFWTGVCLLFYWHIIRPLIQPLSEELRTRGQDSREQDSRSQATGEQDTE